MPTTTTREATTTQAPAREQLLADRREQMREDPYAYFAVARERAKRKVMKQGLFSKRRLSPAH